MPRLENWSIRYWCGAALFAAPEQQSKHLAGNVYGHYKHEDGKKVVTSSIRDINPELRTVETKSGSTYTLGAPDPKWLIWLAENDRETDNVFPHFIE